MQTPAYHGREPAQRPNVFPAAYGRKPLERGFLKKRTGRLFRPPRPSPAWPSAFSLEPPPSGSVGMPRR